MPRTRVPSEQLKFRSQNTGEHDLDLYLEDAELGGLELSELLSKVFDPTTGEVDAFTFRYVNDGDNQYVEYKVGEGEFRVLSSYTELFDDIAAAKADALAAIESDRIRAETAADNAEQSEINAAASESQAEQYKISAGLSVEQARDYASQAYLQTPEVIKNNINVALVNSELFNGSVLDA